MAFTMLCVFVCVCVCVCVCECVCVCVCVCVQEFQDRFEGQEKEVAGLQRSSQKLSPPVQQVESKLNLVVHKCQQMRAISLVYVDR